MYRRWLIAGLIPLTVPVAVARAKPATSGQYNPAVNSDLIRVADLMRAKAALELLPQERRAAATASLEAELQVLVRRVSSSLAI